MYTLQRRSHVHRTLNRNKLLKQRKSHTLRLPTTNIQKRRSKNIHALHITQYRSMSGCFGIGFTLHRPIECVENASEHALCDAFAEEGVCGKSSGGVVADFSGHGGRAMGEVVDVFCWGLRVYREEDGPYEGTKVILC